MYCMNSSRYNAHIDHLIAYLYTIKIKITALFKIEMFYNINKIQNNNLLSMLIEKFGCTCNAYIFVKWEHDGGSMVKSRI